MMTKLSELENKQYNISNKIYFLILEKYTDNMKRISNITSDLSKSCYTQIGNSILQEISTTNATITIKTFY